ncbi:hypothetical protein COTS27_00724 [Spirochaetota bacterium]|nr:hypothetical protein COTS27_00724 [Spirochaetota bacterium]
MHAILYEYFYNKAPTIYDKAPITFHKIELTSTSDRASVEETILDVHHCHNARVIVLNTKPVSEPFLKKLQKGTLLIRYGVGYDNIPLDLCQKLGLLTAYTPDSITQATTEFTIGLMIALTRKIHCHHNNILAGKWDVTKKKPLSYTPLELNGKNLTILGYGRIGQRLAQICHTAFNMKITVFDKEANIKFLNQNQNHSPDHPNAQTKQFSYTSDLKTALADADIVSIHTSLTPQTYQLLNKTSLAYLKPTALIINTARGAIIDNNVLFSKLKEKSIAGAALDVFTQEPYPHYKNLTGIPNLLLTPHQGGNTIEANCRIATVIVNNTISYYKKNLEDIVFITPNIPPSPTKYKYALHLSKTRT